MMGFYMANINCVTVANGKGGVGKTTTCLEILSHAADKIDKDKKLLAIDLDPSGNLGKRLTGTKFPERGVPTITDYLLDPKSVDPADLFVKATQGWPNTYVVRSSPSLVDILLQIATQGGWDKRLKKLVDKVHQFFPLIIIDTGPTLGMLHTMAFKASQSVLIPADTGSDDALTAVHSVKTALEVISDDEPEYCPNNVYVFLAAMHKENSEPSKIAIREFKNQLGDIFLDNLLVPHRAIVGKAVWKHNPPIPAKAIAKKTDPIYSNYKKISDLFI